MVASFMEKTVSKSYVRLPGSGSDKNAGASFCDLSRGSSLAASISVPQQMGMQRYMNAKLASTNQNKRPRTEDDTTETIKRTCLDSTAQNVERTHSQHTSESVTVASAPVTVSSRGSSSSSVPTTNASTIEPVREPLNPTKIYIIKNTVHDVTKLKEENALLRNENASLHKQLSLFKQLMRNPQRLQSVVQRLNERNN